MSTHNGAPKDPDDFFHDTRMSFGDHIEELRTHLWRAILGFGVALLVSMFFGHRVMRFITAPVEAELKRYYARQKRAILAGKREVADLAEANQPTPFRAFRIPRRQLDAIAKGKDPSMPRPKVYTLKEQEEAAPPPTGFRGALDKVKRWWDRVFGREPDPDPEDMGPPPTLIPEQGLDEETVVVWLRVENPTFLQGDLNDSTRLLLKLDSPATLNVQEGFLVWFKVCIVSGIVLGSPWIFWQVWMFVAAGLYPHEKRLVHFYLPISLFLFLAGVAICQFLVIPRAIEALFWFNELMGMRPDVRVNEFLSFAIWMPVVFGASFQTPLVMLFLDRLGVMDIDSFRNKRRLAWFVMAIFAAFITPSMDAFSMLFLWVPMSLLFELGIVMIRLSPRPPDLGIEEPQTDELVEV